MAWSANNSRVCPHAQPQEACGGHTLKLASWHALKWLHFMAWSANNSRVHTHNPRKPVEATF